VWKKPTAPRPQRFRDRASAGKRRTARRQRQQRRHPLPDLPRDGGRHDDKEEITGADLARALAKAAKTAYKGLSNPTEGTILTVIKEASSAAMKKSAGNGKDIIAVMETTVSTAKESVANTPTLLPVLKEAGVVDAGGQGLYTILEGALQYLKGETEQMQFKNPRSLPAAFPLTLRLPEMIAADEVPYGYCTEFMLKGEELDPDKIKTRLTKKGESLIVVGDNTMPESIFIRWTPVISCI